MNGRSAKVLKSFTIISFLALGATIYLVFSALNIRQIALNRSSLLKNLNPRSYIVSSVTGLNPSSYVGSTLPTSTDPGSSQTSPSTDVSQPGDNVSTNWSGYVASNGDYTSVSGSWTVPDANSSNQSSADAAWIGIGGVGSDDLIQVGTQDIVSANGQDTATAFYELLPDSSQSIETVSINPGDKITASLKEVSTGEWEINLVDSTDGQSFNSTVSYNSSESTAEWIEEDPSDGTSLIPLDNFGTVSFYDASTVQNGVTVSLSDSEAQVINMDNSDGQALADVSGIDSSGTGFTVSRTSANSGTFIQEFNSDPEGYRWRGSSIGAFLSNSGFKFKF